MKAFIYGISVDTGNKKIYPLTEFYNDDGSLVEDVSQGNIEVLLADVDDQGSFVTQIFTKVSAYAVAQSYTVTDYVMNTGGTVIRSFANPSRSLNSAFQVSTTRDSQVSYSVDIATTVSLSGGAVGTVFVEYADDSGFTTNVKEIGRMVNGNTGTLVVGLTLNQTATATVGGIVPAGKYVRIRTANTTGTPTFTFRSAQEVLL